MKCGVGSRNTKTRLEEKKLLGSDDIKMLYAVLADDERVQGPDRADPLNL